MDHQGRWLQDCWGTRYHAYCIAWGGSELTVRWDCDMQLDTTCAPNLNVENWWQRRDNRYLFYGILIQVTLNLYSLVLMSMMCATSQRNIFVIMQLLFFFFTLLMYLVSSFTVCIFDDWIYLIIYCKY